MTAPEKLKNVPAWVARKILKRKRAGIVLAGYFNGSCPVCDVHIGADIFRDKLTQQFYLFCGACGREIFQVVDHAGIRWLKPYEPPQPT